MKTEYWTELSFLLALAFSAGALAMNVSSLSGTSKKLAEHDVEIAVLKADIKHIREGIDALLKRR